MSTALSTRAYFPLPLLPGPTTTTPPPTLVRNPLRIRQCLLPAVIYSPSLTASPSVVHSSAEAEDMEIYDLYDNSALPSPQPPSSPALQDGMLELDSVLETIDEDSQGLRPEWRKRAYGPHPFAAPANRKPCATNPSMYMGNVVIPPNASWT